MKFDFSECGIYFLFQKGILQYIGKSEKIFLALKRHRKDGLIFDHCEIKHYRPDELNERLQHFREKQGNNLNQKNRYAEKRKLHTRNKGKCIVKYKAMKLRILSKKSIIGFGRFRYSTVAGIQKRDIIQMYFNLSHISFADEILLEMGITPEIRIPKPGKLEKEE